MQFGPADWPFLPNEFECVQQTVWLFIKMSDWHFLRNTIDMYMGIYLYYIGRYLLMLPAIDRYLFYISTYTNDICSGYTRKYTYFSNLTVFFFSPYAPPLREMPRQPRRPIHPYTGRFLRITISILLFWYLILRSLYRKKRRVNSPALVT